MPEAGLTPMQAIVAAIANIASVTPPTGEAEFRTLAAWKATRKAPHG